MDDDSTPELNEALTVEDGFRLFADHTFLSAIEKRRSSEGDPPLLTAAIDLHNSGRICLFDVVLWPEWAALAGHTFFTVQHFLDKAIPRLKATPEEMMMFVTALVAKGGNDGFANQPNVAFIEWCRRDLERAKAIVSKAEAGHPLAIDHQSFALRALGDLQLARSIVLSSDGLRRLSAVAGLARIPHPNAEELEATVAALARIITGDADDQLRASVVDATVNAFASAKAKLTDAALAALVSALDGGSDIAVHSAAQSLFGNGEILSAQLVTILLAALRHLNPANKGTVNFVDLGLADLVGHGFGTQAVEFLSDLLSRPDIDLSVGEFDSFSHSLVAGDRKLLCGLTARWLLSGVAALCQGTQEILSGATTGEKSITLDLSGEGLTDEEAYFVGRKAIGFFFMKPVVAASILVSLIGGASSEWADAMQDLLFEPLLVNYGGTINDYLLEIPEGDPAYQHVQHVLARGEAYLEGLRSVGAIKELHPSEQNRLLERIRFSEQMREAMKGARKKSVFHGLFKKSIMLYGNRSVSFIEGPDGDRQRFEMELHPLGVTHEWPRIETIDPVGLQEMLFTLRVEQRR
ncbi:MAG: hypothetical protein Q7U20_06950 [Caulobacter sp.]|nr:hypothetical protein [Caulobacter sp.]